GSGSSTPALPASSGTCSAEPPELLASRFEVLELVEARARGAEQDDVAGRGRRGGVRDRALERAVVVAADDGAELRRRFADQVDGAHVRPDRVTERAKVLSFERA